MGAYQTTNKNTSRPATSYAAAAAEHDAREAAVVKSPGLTTAMKYDSYWRNMVRDHGRQTAEMEYACSESIYELRDRNRKQERADQDRRDSIDMDWGLFINQRWQLSRVNIEDRVDFDTRFIEEQAAKGQPLTDFTISKITDMQREDKENLAWQETKRRRQAKADADRQRKKDEAEQRRDDMFVKAVTVAAKAMLQGMLKDVLVSGVFHGK